MTEVNAFQKFIVLKVAEEMSMALNEINDMARGEMEDSPPQTDFAHGFDVATDALLDDFADIIDAIATKYLNIDLLSQFGQGGDDN